MGDEKKDPGSWGSGPDFMAIMELEGVTRSKPS